jgi:hypothetical protein
VVQMEEDEQKLRTTNAVRHQDGKAFPLLFTSRWNGGRFGLPCEL